MSYIGVTTRAGTCAICNKTFPKGIKVYFDASKSQGKHLAHALCWDKLRKSRPLAVGKASKPKSVERLDPPF